MKEIPRAYLDGFIKYSTILVGILGFFYAAFNYKVAFGFNIFMALVGYLFVTIFIIALFFLSTKFINEDDYIKKMGYINYWFACLGTTVTSLVFLYFIF